MKTDFNLKNIVNDYLQGRLSEADRNKFINLYSHLIRTDRERSSAVFDDIHRQVEALNDDEIKIFIEMMNEPHRDAEKTRGSAKAFWTRLAAAIVLISSISFLIFNQLSKQPKITVYNAEHDKMIWLPDSSSVYLKAGSMIRLMEDYGAVKRELLMEGEGFFKVKSDKERPFVVKTASGFYSQVLGTSFLMYATPEKHGVEVKTGKVQVGDSLRTFAILLAGDKIRQDENGAVLLDLNQDVSNTKTFQFTGQQLKDIAQQLEEYYTKEIVLPDKSVGALEYTATFSLNQPLEEIVSVLCELHDLEYELKDNQIIITNH